ncbi:hypothetical protein PHYBOEH_009703 [Phytophthora boehmeriae]|uniref:TKL protein kinase n=1 Tax=Phytophthora boehmeriae TaxID=109152 RepID=A0A8T1WZX2_9STRA|nr:hypothetical protein PHYBOEH_009703 [Phytophthora boehmeriae]
MQTSASESTDGAASPHTSIISTIALPAEIQADEDEEEVTTAEFSVDLTDGQTWAINFYECAAEGDIECLEEILDSGRVGVNDVDVDGFTALMVAAAEGHHNVVRALLRRGADVSVQTFELRSTALHFAAKNGDKETVEALCESDAAVVDCWNVNTDTPLIWACIEGRAEAVQVLLKYGADVNMLNQYGASTVMCAAMIGEDPEQDAETDQPRAEIMKMLLEKSRKLVNFQDREGSTAMHLAASCGYLECVKTLLAFGADITLRNIIGQTPLEEAQGSGIRESGPCVDHLRGMWRQLEEEAAARMMAMLEMEEEAGKSSTNTSGGSKKSKKRNKKAKRKAAAAKQQQEQEQDQQESHQQEDRSADRGDQEVEMATDPPFAQSSHDSTHGSISASQKNSNEECPTSSDEDTPTRDSRVSTGPDLSDDEDDRDVDDGKTDTNHVAGGDKEKSTLDDFTTPVAGAWTTVGKKHRSFLATTSSESTRATAVSGSAFQTADSTVFKCVRCNQVVTKASMTRNSFAQAQAAALGLSMSNSTPAGCANGTQDDSPEEMQRILEASEPRAAAVDIRAFHMIPGTKLSALSNGQLEVLENAHQVALTQIMEQRLANARALERLQMEEWLKMQHDVLQFTPR